VSTLEESDEAIIRNTVISIDALDMPADTYRPAKRNPNLLSHAPARTETGDVPETERRDYLHM
jgi:hypothetical protein